MKVLVSETQYNSLTEENLREFLYSFWNNQKKHGEEPSLDEMIYNVLDFNKNTREDYNTVRPLWYRYNGGYNVLENKIRKEIDTKEFDLIEPEFNLRTKIKVVHLEKVESFLEIMVDVDPRGSINFWGWNEENDEQYEINGTIEDAYSEAESNYETGDLTGMIRASVYDFFYGLLEKYGVPIEVDIDLEEIQGFSSVLEEQHRSLMESKKLKSIQNLVDMAFESMKENCEKNWVGQYTCDEVEAVEKIKVVDVEKVFMKTKTNEEDYFLLVKIDVDYNYIREYLDLSNFEYQLQYETKEIIGNNVRVLINNQNNTRKEFNW